MRRDVDFSAANRPLHVLLIGPRSQPGAAYEDAYIDNLLASPPPGIRYTLHTDLIAKGEARRIPWVSNYASATARLAGGPIQLDSLASDAIFDLIHIHAVSARLSGLTANLPVILSESSHSLENLIAEDHWMPVAVQQFAHRKRLALQAIHAYDPAVNFREAVRLIVWSDWARRKHVQWGTPEEVIAVIPPYVPPVSIAFNPPVAMGKPPHYLFVGNAFARKNGPMVLAAFRKIRSQLPKGTRLTIVGAPTEELDSPEEGITHLPLLSQKRLYAEVYPDANIFVLPSSAEGYGLSVIEAMSAGIAPIVSHFGVLPEIASDAGLVVDVAAGQTPESVAHLAEAMLRLGNDPVLRAVLGSRARERYHIYGARSVTLEPLAALYREAVHWQGVVLA